MKTVEVIGYKRANLGKTEAKSLREEGNVPCVLYGGKDQVHFHSPMILFRDVVYTKDACFVELNIEGEKHRAILQDIQFHPVSEIILHADFLEIFDGKAIKMAIPVRTHGVPPGVQKGGKLTLKNPYLDIRALPKDMPEFVDINVGDLDLGGTVRVYEIEVDNYEILNNSRVTIAMMNVPRGAKEFDALEASDEEELIAAGEATEEGEATDAEGDAEGDETESKEES